MPFVSRSNVLCMIVHSFALFLPYYLLSLRKLFFSSSLLRALFDWGGIWENPLWMDGCSVFGLRAGGAEPDFPSRCRGAGSGGRNDAETSAHNGCRGACSRRVTRTPETASWFDAAAGRRVRPGAPHKSRYKGRHSAYMVGPVGFEPTTNGL